jgi:hyaluronate lyase
MIGYVSIISGIFQKDYKRIAISKEMLREIFQNAELGDGFYDDGSFIQHDLYAFAGLYGEALFNSLSKISYIFDDS